MHYSTHKLLDHGLITSNNSVATTSLLSESPKQKEPWTITQVHTNGTIRVTCGTKSEQLNVWRVEPFFEKEE